MHEAKVCLSLLALAEDTLRADGSRRIHALCVEVGALSGVAPEALEAAFPICAAGTAAAGATLRIERVEGRVLMLRDMEVS